ncbi:IclR family transcriptional regulator C-terminal domain-containing protein [Microvirga massiliensis]|uniref:IclR family transcriptional regulator domain-containing protein n=1 Tax=Microvirga massiliensis TaxID=1033741 RepID=UPI00069E79B0
MSRPAPKARERLVRSLALTKHTANTITDPDVLLGVIEEIRRRGWGKTNEEFVKGVVGCAVPILTPKRDLIAYLGVSVPAARVSFAELDRFIPPL